MFAKVAGAMTVDMVQETEMARFFGLTPQLQVEVGGEIFQEGEKKKVHVLLIPAVFVDMLWFRMGWDSDPFAG